MSKVCLLGAPLGTANMGVTALAISFVKIIRHLNREMDVTLLVGSDKSGYKQIDLGESTYNIKIVNYRMSPRSRLQEHLLWILWLSFLCRIFPNKKFVKNVIGRNPFLREIVEADFVGNIHGGDSFSDIYGLESFFYAVLPNFVAILLNKPLVLLPQTYGPYEHKIAKRVACFIMKKSFIILCRDKDGPDKVRKIINDTNISKKIHFCPDVAFFLHGNEVSLPDIFQDDRNGKKKNIIGINVNGLMYKDVQSRRNRFGLIIDYGKLINSVIQKFLIESDANILLIPHNNAASGDIESDMDACEEVARNIQENLRNRVHIIEHKHYPSEIKGVISKCDFFIGSRMHSCIAALTYGIPTIGIAYSKKFIGVFESVGAYELVVDARLVDIETAINLIWKHFEDRNLLGDSIKTRIPAVQNKIIDTFKCVTELCT